MIATKRYLLKEYGSWAVLIFSFISGLIVSEKISWHSIFVFLGLCLLVNSKQALVMGYRLISLRPNAYYIFLMQILSGSTFLIIFAGPDVLKLYPFGAIALVYIISLLWIGEHSIFTEIGGFFTLCLSSLVGHFSVTHEMDIRLYLAVTLFFVAGVFKVRIQLEKGLKERLWMIFYIILAIFSFMSMKINPLILIPLFDNLFYALTFYRIRIKTTGWIEVLKGAIFLILLHLLYNKE